MQKLILLIYHFFRNLFQHKPKSKPEEYSSFQEYSSSVYRTAAGKSEPENNLDPKIPESIPILPLRSLSFPEVQSPLKIHRTDDYSPIKNLNTKEVIKVKQVSREEALRLSNLPLTNDMSEIGDDTVKVPTRSGQFLYITPKPVMADENYKAEQEKFTTFINTIVEPSKEDK